MSIFESLALAFSLSVDACVICLLYAQLPLTHSSRLKLGLCLAGTFGLCQLLMPLIGFYGGQSLASLIAAYDHWVAFALLSVVALNMLRDLRSEKSYQTLSLNWPLILILGIATSLDALAVGFSLGMVIHRIVTVSLIIGSCCFVLSLCCYYLGLKLHQVSILNRSLNLTGALILLLIGILILYEHGVFS